MQRCRSARSFPSKHSKANFINCHGRSPRKSAASGATSFTRDLLPQRHQGTKVHKDLCSKHNLQFRKKHHSGMTTKMGPADFRWWILWKPPFRATSCTKPRSHEGSQSCTTHLLSAGTHA